MKRKVIGILSLILCLLLSISLVACNKDKHEAKSEWMWNDAQHWHECATKGHDDKLDEAPHEFNEGVITTPATITTPGVKTYTCTVCGKTKTEPIAVIDYARFSIAEAFNLSGGAGTVVVGTVVKGTINENDTLNFYGANGPTTVTVTGIQVDDASVTSVTPQTEGEIALRLNNISANDVETGDWLISSTVDVQKAKLVTVSLYFKTEAEGGRKTPTFVNYRPKFLLGNRTNYVTLVSFSGNATKDMIMPGETVTATLLLADADYILVDDEFTLGEGGKEVATGKILSVDGIETDMTYRTGDVDFSKTVYVDVELGDGEWKITMDTGIATYKVYDSEGNEITVEDGVFDLAAADTVTIIFTPVDGGAVGECIIQQYA